MSGRAIDAITKHWHATKATRGQVVAFGGLVIHWGPWTLGERDRVFGPFTDPGGRVILRDAVWARMLVVKAEDAAGKPLFAPAEEDELLAEADPREVQRVGVAMMAAARADDAAGGDDAGPKSSATQGGSPPST